MMTLAEADKKEHPVETQWHYPIMTKYGYQCITPVRVGLVRSYDYIHPETGNKVKVTTGVSGDYWDAADGAGGWWGELEPHLEKTKKS